MREIRSAVMQTTHDDGPVEPLPTVRGSRQVEFMCRPAHLEAVSAARLRRDIESGQFDSGEPSREIERRLAAAGRDVSNALFVQVDAGKQRVEYEPFAVSQRISIVIVAIIVIQDLV